LVEQRIENPRVLGSIPRLATSGCERKINTKPILNSLLDGNPSLKTQTKPPDLVGSAKKSPISRSRKKT
jgi:hypothetical protein